MRLAKPAVVAFELVAAGGAVLVLSGSALASDAGLGTGPADGSTTTVQQQTQQTTTTQTGVTTVDTTKPIDTSGAPGDSTGQIKPAGEDLSGAKPASGSVSPSVQTDKGTGIKLDGVTTSSPAIKQGVAPTSAGLSVTMSSPVPAVTDDLPQVPVRPVYHKTTVLPLQPTITARSADVSDLASTVPTPPKPNKAPVPAKSSGLLGKLTAELGRVVVPQSFGLPVLGFARLTDPQLFGLLELILLGVFVFTYGLWLRRGGFATAARSDSPIAGASLYLLHHSFWVMFQRRRAKDITHFLVSEPAGVRLMGAA